MWVLGLQTYFFGSTDSSAWSKMLLFGVLMFIYLLLKGKLVLSLEFPLQPTLFESFLKEQGLRHKCWPTFNLNVTFWPKLVSTAMSVTLNLILVSRITFTQLDTLTLRNWKLKPQPGLWLLAAVLVEGLFQGHLCGHCGHLLVGWSVSTMILYCSILIIYLVQYLLKGFSKRHQHHKPRVQVHWLECRWEWSNWQTFKT